jgi:hypothetical protein
VQVSGAAHALSSQHASPLPPHPPQLADPHVVPLAHVVHVTPPLPHAPLSVPTSHALPEQHPVHDVASQAHTPLTQCSPPAHVPLVHTPPQSSLAPHALPAQLGVQPHTLAAPPPPHDSGDAHVFPAQHACPLPPQMPHVVPHVVPGAQAAHTTPPMPQAFCELPDWQAVPSQHPEHEVGSHAQVPCRQWSPWAHVPCVHTPSQPLLAPHDLPVQLDAHGPSPQWLGTPPPPHVRPMSQPPHSMSVPQRSKSCPQLPWQSAKRACIVRSIDGPRGQRSRGPCVKKGSATQQPGLARLSMSENGGCVRAASCRQESGRARRHRQYLDRLRCAWRVLPVRLSGRLGL